MLASHILLTETKQYGMGRFYWLIYLVLLLLVELGLPMLPDRVLMMYPPTYDEATLHNTEAIDKSTLVSFTVYFAYFFGNRLQSRAEIL